MWGYSDFILVWGPKGVRNEGFCFLSISNPLFPSLPVNWMMLLRKLLASVTTIQKYNKLNIFGKCGCRTIITACCASSSSTFKRSHKNRVQLKEHVIECVVCKDILKKTSIQDVLLGSNLRQERRINTSRSLGCDQCASGESVAVCEPCWIGYSHDKWAWDRSWIIYV